MIKTVAQLLEKLRQVENDLLKKENIKHAPTIGDMYEGLTKELLERAIPSSKELKVTSGFITDDKGNLSAQLDCLLVSGKGETIPRTSKFKYRIDDVIAVIEVKKNLYATDIRSGYKNLRSVMNFTPSTPRGKALLRDAFQSITRRPLPRHEDLDKQPFEIQMIYHTLVVELTAPVRIIFGYNGFKSHSSFRDAFITYLSSQQVNGQPAKGFGAASFPNLIICDNFSLVKCNGMPFIAPLDENYFWPFYCSAAKNPVELILELIWTRLVYQEQLDFSVFDEDLYLADFAPFISGKPIQQGWEYKWIVASEEQLKGPTELKLWEPAFLDSTQFAIMSKLCSEESIDLADANLLSFLGNGGWQVDAFVKSLNTAGLAARDGNKLVLLTRGCSCVILPDGRKAAGENTAGQFSRWVSLYMAARRENSCAD